MDRKMRSELDATLELWKRFWGEELDSAYLYGSAARGDWHRGSSDINLLFLVTERSYERWQEAAQIVQRKQKKGFAVPLVLTPNYLASSLDSYPIEFLDIHLFHETLSGEDRFAGLDFDRGHLRLQAEREVKGKWVQLRQAALEAGTQTTAMRALLSASVSTWVAVFQALLVIEGREVPSERALVLGAGADLAGLDPAVFQELERLRRTSGGLNRSRAWKLLTATLQQVDLLARWVDGWSELEKQGNAGTHRQGGES